MTVSKIRLELSTSFGREPTRECWPSSFEDTIGEAIRFVSQSSLMGRFGFADLYFYDHQAQPPLRFRFGIRSQHSGKWYPNGYPIPLDNGKVDIVYRESPDRDIEDAMPYIDMAKRLVPHGSRFVVQRWGKGAEDIVEGL